MFIVDAKRISTMRKRLGDDASSIIKSDEFLPMFRNRQKQYPEEFDESVKLAKCKKNPGRYLASIWSLKNLEQTLEWLSNKISQMRAKIREAVIEKKKQAERRLYGTRRNDNFPIGIDKIIANRMNVMTIKS